VNPQFLIQWSQARANSLHKLDFSFHCRAHGLYYEDFPGDVPLNIFPLMNNEDKDAIDAITDEANAKVQKIDEEFEAKAKDLHARAAKLKNTLDGKKERLEESRRSDGESAKGLGVGLTIAYGIIGAPLVGFGVGYLIDRSLGGTTWSGILGLLGAGGGLWFAVVVLNKTNK
jgi:F0F1-type ATP synthase assembly protein I